MGGSPNRWEPVGLLGQGDVGLEHVSRASEQAKSEPTDVHLGLSRQAPGVHHVLIPTHHATSVPDATTIEALRTTGSGSIRAIGPMCGSAYIGSTGSALRRPPVHPAVWRRRWPMRVRSPRRRWCPSRRRRWPPRWRHELQAVSEPCPTHRGHDHGNGKNERDRSVPPHPGDCIALARCGLRTDARVGEETDPDGERAVKGENGRDGPRDNYPRTERSRQSGQSSSPPARGYGKFSARVGTALVPLAPFRVTHHARMTQL